MVCRSVCCAGRIVDEVMYNTMADPRSRLAYKTKKVTESRKNASGTIDWLGERVCYTFPTAQG